MESSKKLDGKFAAVDEIIEQNLQRITLAHFDNIPMLFDAAYNLHKMVGMENVRKFMRETFEKDFDDLSKKTKVEFEPRYKAICEVVLGKTEVDSFMAKS